MIAAPKTLAAVDRFTLAREASEQHRGHLGASTMGEECNRKVFYSYRWASPKAFQPHILRLFNRGHREEPALFALLRGAGYTVYSPKDSEELKESMQFSAYNGHMGGTPDGVIVGIPDLPSDTPALLEMKTYNDKQFNILIADGVYNHSRKYYVQMQLYMHHLDLKWALFVAVNKNDDKLHFELVEYKQSMAESYMAFAGDVIQPGGDLSKLPKISNSPGFWQCKLCDHNLVCQQDVSPVASCRTCKHGAPSHISNSPGLWTCARQRPEIETQPRKGCGAWSLNLDYFVDDVPF